MSAIEYLNDRIFSSIEKTCSEQTKTVFTESDWIHRSYIPLYDRYHIERLRLEGREEDIHHYLAELSLNIETNLKERFNVTESIGKFFLIDGDIYSEHFPEEPFGQVILRGANVRKEKGSSEFEREGFQGELGGWLEIKKILIDNTTSIGTKIVSFSPPGRVENTAYKGHFVDIFELALEDNRKFIKRSRLAVSYSDRQYAEKATILKSDFFDNFDGRPLDAWYLSHPIVTQKNLHSFFELANGMSGEQFQRVYGDPTLQRLIGAYKHEIIAKDINWNHIHIIFNAILNRADEVAGERQHSEHVLFRNSVSKHSLIDDIYSYGLSPVREVVGGGCPTNKGFSIGLHGLTLQDIFSNSIAQFGNESTATRWEYHLGSCVVCQSNYVDVGPCSICKDCEKKF